MRAHARNGGAVGHAPITKSHFNLPDSRQVTHNLLIVKLDVVGREETRLSVE